MGSDILDGVFFTEQGKLHRHTLRGEMPEDARERKKREDDAAWCGNRNPSSWRHAWPELWEVMGKIGGVIRRARAQDKDLQHLIGSFGDEPTRGPQHQPR